MTKEQLKKATDISQAINTIDRIMKVERVIITSNGNKVELDFNDDFDLYDINYVVRNYIKNDFLKLLYDKRIDLEKEFNEL